MVSVILSYDTGWYRIIIICQVEYSAFYYMEPELGGTLLSDRWEVRDFKYTYWKISYEFSQLKFYVIRLNLYLKFELMNFKTYDLMINSALGPMIGGPKLLCGNVRKFPIAKKFSLFYQSYTLRLTSVWERVWIFSIDPRDDYELLRQN